MVQPFDYTINSPSPAQMFIGGLDAGQMQRAREQQMTLQAEEAQRAQTLFDQGQQDRMAAQAEAEAQRQEALRLDSSMLALGEKVASGQATFQDFARLSLENPGMAAELKGVWDGLSAERRQNDAAGMARAATAIRAKRPDLAITMLEDYATAAENSGQKMDADLARATAGIIKADPNAGLTQLGILLQSVAPDMAEVVFGKGKSVQSSVTLDDGTTISTFDDGTKQVSDAAGTVIEGQAAIDAVKAANEYGATLRRENAAAAAEGRIGTTIEMGGTAKAAEEAGKQSIKASGEAFDALNKVNRNIITIDEAVAALDAGAATGAVQRYLPNVTEASATLENAMNRLGLDVISSVTFGALSEGEMRLAMETAVPRNLGEKALRSWLVDKKAAQEKAAEALTAAAIYLGTPGNTLATWLASKNPRPDDAASGQGSPPSQSTPEMVDVPDGSPAAGFVQKYGRPRTPSSP